MAIAITSLAKTGGLEHPPLISVYGTPGIGKTSLALEFPEALYATIEGEGQPHGIAATVAPVASYGDLMDPDDGYIAQLLTTEHPFRTLVVDSLDAFEPMVWRATCDRNGWDTIDSNDKGSPTAFGKGYLAADYEWRDYVAAARALTRAGIAVVQILHSEAKTFNDPLAEPYDRYRPKLQKRAVDIITEKSDALLFISRRQTLKTVDKGMGQKGQKPMGMGGEERIIYTDERAGFIAKNRLNMPASITYRKGQGYTELAKYFGVGAAENDNSPASVAA